MLDQISPPMRVVLVAALAFLAIWFVALRPKPVSDTGSVSSTPTAPGVQGLSNDVTKAKDAVKAADAAGAANAGTATTPAAKAPAAKAPATKAPAAKAPAAPAAPSVQQGADALASLGPVQRALRDGHTVVLLFTNRKGSDDAAMRAAVARLSTHGGKVVKVSTTPKHLARYGRITRAVQVLQTPTVVIVDTKGRAVPIPGFQDDAVLEQAVADALH